jgi:YVTN family beta-propeller protein
MEPSTVRRLAVGSLCALVTGLAGLPRATAAPFVTFESGQVRPLALSADTAQLYAVNTPDNRLEIFDVGAGTLTHSASVPVGMEPVAVAARTNTEVWVVNHLSDSVSIIDVGAVPPRVTRTLLVGDEPRDIVFAGPGRTRAFITTAHRGQNNPNDPQLTTPGVGRADVWVFDAIDLGSDLGGTPLTIVTLFGDTPRALAVSPDGSTVYAAVFHSGNQTAAVNEGAVCNDSNLNDDTVAGPCTVDGVTMPGGLPNPERSIPDNRPRPETGLVVKFNPAVSQWQDRLGRNWNPAIKFTLPDKDVFKIDANATPPVQVSGAGGFFTGVGTILFNMAVNPVSGKVYVTNGDAHNEVRFEGPGGGGSTVRGHLDEYRITVLDGASVLPRHLNKHIVYSTVPSPSGTAAKSLATPLGMALTADGATLYVAAFGSSKIGVFATSTLEDDTFVPDTANQITVSGGGPSGVVLDEARHQLYVLTRFDNGVAVINTTTRMEVAHPSLYNPEPANVVNGRPFLYDAAFTSSNGEAACASCHIFADFDSLAWDLGNPDDSVLNNPNPFRVGPFIDPDFHPMKGPMTTQSLRGMAAAGPMHWRGDRTGGNDVGGNALDSNQAFMKFNVAFAGLLGRSGPLTVAEMQAFTDFILQVTYPPNPIRALANGLTTDQAAGRTFFLSSSPSDTLLPCNGCHRLDPAHGHFGTDGFSSFEGEAQVLKIPHLRNAYQKVGMFGFPSVPGINAGNNGDQGDQVRGFGFLHDGAVDTVFRFHNAKLFNHTNSNTGGFTSDVQRRQVEQFILAFDSNMAPIVGQQITLTSDNAATVNDRIDLLVARAAVGECDLTVKGTLAGEARGWYRTAAGTFQSDRVAEVVSDAALRAQAATVGQELTYTCVPPGSGVRVGVDRDEDTYFDRDELDFGSDPANAAVIPGPIPGGGAATTDCMHEWLTDPVPAARDRRGAPKRRLECTDDDPACDFGAASGDLGCTFHVALCLNVNDPRLVYTTSGLLQCHPSNVERVSLKRPREDLPANAVDAANRDALEAALIGLGGALSQQCVSPLSQSGRLCAANSTCDGSPGSGNGLCGGRLVAFTPPLSDTDQCSAFAAISVPLRNGRNRGMKTLRVRATPSVDQFGQRRPTDSDTLTLVCKPKPTP